MNILKQLSWQTFLGQTNLFEGTVAGIEGDELVVKVKDVTFYVPTKLQLKLEVVTLYLALDLKKLKLLIKGKPVCQRIKLMVLLN